MSYGVFECLLIEQSYEFWKCQYNVVDLANKNSVKVVLAVKDK